MSKKNSSDVSNWWSSNDNDDDNHGNDSDTDDSDNCMWGYNV